MTTDASTRSDRRKARTRAALVAAAQGFLAEGRTGVPVQEVTETADVGIGTFYNHFATKEELFDAALADAVERLGDVLDAVGVELDDPAEVFARSFRLVGRLHRAEPRLSRVVLQAGVQTVTATTGLAPRVRRDLAAARDAGRLTFPDLDAAMVVVVGAATSLGHLLHDEPERDADATTDEVTVVVLQALGLAADDAHDVCARPLGV